ncbi:MAG: hypothetical protein Q7J80_02455 [Anaerolineales bacterium]|nr:hypothetical protein [Anaerolineales bacterium]
MKIFLSSAYLDLIEHRKAAQDENHPRIKPRTFGEWESGIRAFVCYSWTVYPWHK